MSQALSATSPSQSAHSAYQDCLAALLHPSITTYRMLGQQRAGVWRAYLLMFASSLIAGAIDSLVPFESQVVGQSSVDVLLLALIPVTALMSVCSLAAFAWCAQNVARFFKGSAVYTQLVYVFATISAPLLIVDSIVDQIPVARIVLVVIYFYWLAQYVAAIRALNDLSRMKAIAAVFLALLMLGLVWIGVAFLIGYSGILLP